MSRPRSASCAAMISIGAHSADDGRLLPLRDWVPLVEPWRIARDLRETAGSRRSRRRDVGLHSVGAIVVIKFKPSGQDEPIPVNSRVVRYTTSGFAVEFLSLNKATQQVIEGLD